MNREQREKAIAWLKEEIRSLERAPELNGCPMTPEWSEQLDIMRTCLEAVQDHFPDTTKMVPLTLEQLREMDGNPVWIVESPDWGHWELSEDAEDYICDRDADLYGLTYPDPDGKAGLHKLGWVAYAYQPAHIDREMWEPCGEMCRNNCATCDHNADELFGDADYCKDCHRYSKWESSIHKYCERCGRPRTPEALAELENRLRGTNL